MCAWSRGATRPRTTAAITPVGAQGEFVIPDQITSATRTTPAWHANYAPDSRYTVDQSALTVIDQQTGLMWGGCLERSGGVGCSVSETIIGGTLFSWQEALERAAASTQSGFADWRLPTIKELASLAAHDRLPALNLTVFPNLLALTDIAQNDRTDTLEIVSNGKVWSATPYRGARAGGLDNRRVWGFDFATGEDAVLEISVDQGVRANTNYLLLVRDANGSGVDIRPSVPPQPMASAVAGIDQIHIAWEGVQDAFLLPPLQKHREEWCLYPDRDPTRDRPPPLYGRR